MQNWLMNLAFVEVRTANPNRASHAGGAGDWNGDSVLYPEVSAPLEDLCPVTLPLGIVRRRLPSRKA